MTPAQRHRAAVAAWAVRGAYRWPWRECIAIGLAASEPIKRGHDKDAVITERIAPMVRERMSYDVARLITYAWTRDAREQRAIADTRVGVGRVALARLHAVRGGKTTWRDVALLSLAEVARWDRTVYIDRARWQEQVERVAAEEAPQPSRLGVLMGWGD